MDEQRPIPEGSILLALDQGGSSSRAIAFDRAGEVVASASVPVSERREGEDQVEQDPEELVESLCSAVRECVRSLGTDGASRIFCAGLATQRSSIVCWDRDSGRALSPVLSWQDRRAKDRLEALADRGDEIRERTGLRLSPHYGATKLAWCLEHLEPVRRARAASRLVLGPLASFLVFRLLDERPLAADPANASRTLLWSLAREDWDPELCATFGVPIDALPPCTPTERDFGTLGVGGPKIPFRVLTGDQSAALFALGPPRADTAFVNVGTGAFVQRAVAELPRRIPRLLASVVWSDGKESRRVVEGTINGAGSALRWLEAELGLADVETQLAGWLESSDEPPLFLNGVSGLAAPFWVPDFRSRFVGEGTPASRAVAVLESVLFLACTILDEMALGIPRPARILASGGLARLDGLCDRLASLAGVPVDRATLPEATARGLAWLLSGSKDPWPEATAPRRFLPREDARLAARYRQWRLEMDRALRERS
ncbi:MAG: FGGY family carbohydrate kinase [Planctomycetota bacterium]